MLTKVFESGNSQAVRLPKKFRFNVSEVEIFERGEEIVIKKKSPNVSEAFNLLKQLNSEGVFEKDRQDSVPQERNFF